MIYGFGQDTQPPITDVDTACGGIWTEGTIGELKALRNAAVGLATRLASSVIVPFAERRAATNDIGILNDVWFRGGSAYADGSQPVTVMPDADIESTCRAIGRIYNLSRNKQMDPLIVQAREELESVSMQVLRRHLPTDYQLKPRSKLAPVLYAGVALVIAGLIILYYRVNR